MDHVRAPPPETRAILAAVQGAIVDTAASSLVGLYLHGSLVSGGFDPRVSDLDLIAVLSEDPSDGLAARLEAMHESLARRYPRWAGRVEVVYVSVERLHDLDEPIPRMAVISPGEPFHVITAGPDWVLTWHPAREEAVALIGPPIAEVMAEPSGEAFMAAVRERLSEFRTGCEDTDPPGSCAYAILTTCRGLYTLAFGSRPTKAEAAAWAAREYPEWADVIHSALRWREEQWRVRDPDPEAIAATRSFLQTMTESVEP
jgi:hypothetical protein